MGEKLVDLEVYELACAWVDEMVKEVGRPILPSQRDALDQRLAAAAQQALEDEYEAIREELAAGDGGPRS